MSTYTYRDAINFCVRLAKGIPSSNIDALAVDQVNSMFWKAYPWGWTRDSLTPIPLSNGVQDYALDSADVNKVWRMTGGRVAYTSVSPVKFRDVRIARHLEPFLEANISWPGFQLISYEVEYDVLRFEGPISVPAGVTLELRGEYQLFPPKITSLEQDILFPDYHLDVFVDGMLWMIYRLADDKRAGSAVKTPGGVQYTGQMGIFYDKLVMTKEAEEHGAEDTIYPGESIGGSMNLPNFFGFGG